MRYSTLLGKTVKETPKDATVVSHQLLIRAGFLYQTAAGLYSMLPLGFRVFSKIDRIIREELSRVGMQHLLMPIVHPASLWKESGRYDDFDVLAKFSNDKGQDFVIAPTHEETVTDIARHFIKSYKDLPFTVNQNQTKFRNELRVQGGLLRTREFIMQDAYSFDADEAGLDVSFQKARSAYIEIFKRLGLEIMIVQADSGAMGGSGSEEFVVATEVGEDRIMVCNACSYRANREIAASHYKEYPQDTTLKPREDILAEGVIGVEALAAHLNIPVHQATKTLFFEADGQFVVALIRADYDIHEAKLAKVLACKYITLAGPELVQKITGATVGYAGPINLPKTVKVIADISCQKLVNFEAGTNKTGYHSINVNFERDFPTPTFADIRMTEAGDTCTQCAKGTLSMVNAVELGHIFKLGTRYSVPMKVTFNDRDGTVKPVIMGCYGIGMTRALAAIVETHHDERGIIWPASVAPYAVHLISIGATETEAQHLYDEFQKHNIDVLFDERDERPGAKFADADLIGLPVRLVISEKTLKEQSVECKLRTEDKATLIKLSDIVNHVLKLL